MTSDAARKAWATRRKKNPERFRKRQKFGEYKPRPLSAVEKKAKKGQTIYYSEAENRIVSKHGPKWFLNAQARKEFIDGGNKKVGRKNRGRRRS